MFVWLKMCKKAHPNIVEHLVPNGHDITKFWRGDIADPGISKIARLWTFGIECHTQTNYFCPSYPETEG